MKSVKPGGAEGVGNSDGLGESGVLVMEPALDHPKQDDEYLGRTAERLVYNYDLQREYTVRGEQFGLLDSVRMGGQRQFLHWSIDYANHHAMECMFVWQVDTATVVELEWSVELDHTLADEWIKPNEEHYGMEFTFVLATDAVPEEARAFVSDLADRILPKFGYYGHYEMNLAVVAPSGEDAMVNRNADSVTTLTLWSDGLSAVADGLSDQLLGRLRW